MARRCLGKGSAKDKLVLNTLVRQVLCAKEEEEMPTEMEEPVASNSKKEKTNLMNTYSSKTLNILEGFTKENKLAYKRLHFPNSNNVFNINHFGNPLHSIQPNVTESKSIANKLILINNPSLCEGLGESEITGGHGVVKCALPRTFEKKRKEQSVGHQSVT